MALSWCGGCLWRFSAAHLFDLYFFQEKTNRPLWSFSASFCFIFMQLQSHSHVGAAQCEHALLLLATEQLRRTDVPKSKECRRHGALAARWMSSSSSGSGLMNTPPLLSLFGVPGYCVVTIALIFFQGSHFIYCNSLQLLRSWFLWCVHSHTRYWNIECRIQVNEKPPTLNVPTQTCPCFVEADNAVPPKLCEPLVKFSVTCEQTHILSLPFICRSISDHKRCILAQYTWITLVALFLKSISILEISGIILIFHWNKRDSGIVTDEN